jgi:hypothetical protein
MSFTSRQRRHRTSAPSRGPKPELEEGQGHVADPPHPPRERGATRVMAPGRPTQPFRAAAALVMLATGAVSALAALGTFRRRDLLGA